MYTKEDRRRQLERNKANGEAFETYNKVLNTALGNRWERRTKGADAYVSSYNFLAGGYEGELQEYKSSRTAPVSDLQKKSGATVIRPPYWWPE